MANRVNQEQSAHDSQIQQLTNAYRAKGWTVWPNHITDKIYEIDNSVGEKIRPDLFVGQNGSVNFLVEVETIGTVNSQEVDQWKSYSKTPHKLYLNVPAKTVQQAQLLCINNKIPAEAVGY